jgi:hypothetical protein
VLAPRAGGLARMSRWQRLTLAALAASLGGIGQASAITIIYTPAIADPELLHGYGAPEPAVLVKNTSDISAIVTFGSVPNSGGGMTDRDDDDTADVTVYVSYLVEAEIESQPEDLLLPAFLDR